MDLPVPTNLANDQKASDRLTLSRPYAASTDNRTVAHALESLLPLLAKTTHAYKDGHLILRLDEKFLSHSASVIIAAAERMPEITKKILFFDADVNDLRSYDDVVWNIEKHPRRLAALAYKDDAHSSHIIVTPAVRGNNSHDRTSLDCEKIMMPDSPVEGLGMVVRLRATDAFGAAVEWQNIDAHQGQRKLVHANDVVISGFDEFTLPDPVMFMDIAVRPAHSRAFMPPSISAPAMHYDRTI